MRLRREDVLVQVDDDVRLLREEQVEVLERFRHHERVHPETKITSLSRTARRKTGRNGGKRRAKLIYKQLGSSQSTPITHRCVIQILKNSSLK